VWYLFVDFSPTLSNTSQICLCIERGIAWRRGFGPGREGLSIKIILALFRAAQATRGQHFSMFHFSLVKKFSLLLLLALVAFSLLLGELMSSAMRSIMISSANEITSHFLQHEVESHLQDKRIPGGGDAAELRSALAREGTGLDLGPNVAITDIQVWDKGRPAGWTSGGIEGGPQGPVAILAAMFSGLFSAEGAGSLPWAEKLGMVAPARQTLTCVVPVRLDSSGKGELGLKVEADFANLAADIDWYSQAVWLAVLSGCLLLYLLLYGLYWGAARQIEQQNGKIRLSEERFRNLIHTAEEGIVAADRNGTVLLMNRAAEKIFGFSLDPGEPLQFARLFLLEKHPALRDQLTLFGSGKEWCPIGKTFQAEGCRKNGETFSLEVSLSVSGEKGSCILTGIIRDTSQRDQLLAQIADAELEWEETFNTINDAITIHDQNFTIVRANRAAAEMLGQPLDALLGQKCFRSYHGHGAPPVHCPSCNTLKTGIGSTSEVYEPFLDKHIEVKALPKFDEQNRLTGLVHVVRDITARKKAEEKQQKLQEQLNQVQKMESIGRLAGGIAHDFNNILSVVIGYSELVQRALPKESVLVKDIAVIREAGEKAAGLTSQLLAFSRKQVLTMRPVDLNRVVEELGRMLRRVIGEDILLDLHLSSRIGPVIADSGQIEQVLINLAVNARDAMPAGGHFILSTSTAEIDKEYIDHHAEAKLGHHVLLAVTDTGSGMPAHVKEHIFEPFFTTKEAGKGTGLGLATVYGIVKQHGGQIYVYSEPGKGTTFKIYLPSAQETEVKAGPIACQDLPTGSETILIAEDDANIRAMFKSCLEPMGYTVLLAAEGREALDLSKKHPGRIHLLLTDVIMPNMNGQELADALRNQRPDMGVLFMSGYTDDVIAHHGVLEPGINFIQKPITLSILAHKLRDVLNKS
jgi:PAS domain S-box-containing protein